MSGRMRGLLWATMLSGACLACLAARAIADVPDSTDTGARSVDSAGGGERSTSVGPALDQARRLLTEGAYDEAIGLLRTTVAEASADSSFLQQAYLLLIKAYVTAGNYYRFRARGTVTSDLYYQEAEEVIRECLLTDGLSHTIPDPPQEYPPEMFAAFERVRQAYLGSLRIAEIDPLTATVRLNGDEIGLAADGSALEVHDLPAGAHRLEVHADGYEEMMDDIQIAAGSTLELSYTLQKNKGLRWWATRVGGAVAVGVIIATVASGSDPGGDALLPEPPSPPE